MIKRFSDFIKESDFWGLKGSGIILIARDTRRILLGLRSESVNEPHTWGNFGGAIGLSDHGEVEEELEPLENAIKEMREEIGYVPNNLEIMDSYIYENGDFRYYNFLGFVEEEFDVSELELNWEVEEVRWYTFDEVTKLDNLHYGLETLLKHDSKNINI